MATNVTTANGSGAARPPAKSRRAAGGPGAVAWSWVKRAALWVPLVALILWTFMPFLITLSVSLKSQGEVYSNFGLIPNEITIDAYRRVIDRPGFQGAFINSVVVGIGTTLLTLVLSVPAAYAFARFNFRGRHLLLLFTLLPRLVPSLGLMIPLYRMAVAAGMLDKRLTLIIVYSGMLLPLATWLLVGFFQALPREMEEAANVDGATLWTRLRYIVLPLTFPALMTIGVLAFREAWNEFTLVLVLTSTPGKRTLPYELFLMGGIQGLRDFPGEAAFALLTVIPFILVYMRIERYVVAGITTGSAK
jgi:ABC-type glycerol-3-phosphate transport system permease component